MPSNEPKALHKLHEDEHDDSAPCAKRVLVYGWDSGSLTKRRLRVDTSGKIQTSGLFEDYQYMGSQSSGDYVYYGFKQYGGTSWYIMRKNDTDASDWDYAYSTIDTGTSWSTAWSDPTTLTFDAPPDS